MANTPQARKRARQAEKRREHNTGQRSQVRTALRKVIRAIRDGNKEAAQTAYQAAVPIIDKMANKGIIHKNKAARHKSRLDHRIKALA